MWWIMSEVRNNKKTKTLLMKPWIKRTESKQNRNEFDDNILITFLSSALDIVDCASCPCLRSYSSSLIGIVDSYWSLASLEPVIPAPSSSTLTAHLNPEMSPVSFFRTFPRTPWRRGGHSHNDDDHITSFLRCSMFGVCWSSIPIQRGKRFRIPPLRHSRVPHDFVSHPSRATA